MLVSPYVLAALERDYEIHGVIGHGAYGVVLSATKLASGAATAIKVIVPVDKSMLMPSNAVRELAVVGAERHQNIVCARGVTVFDVGVVAVEMELYDGTLRDLMDSHASYHMTLNDTRFIFSELVRGCAAVFARKGVIHRDLKPENVLIRARGNEVAVADWGVCRCGADTVTCLDVPYSAEVVTTWYAPPEALAGQGHYDAAVDIWSLGVILAEMMAGRPLFTPSRCARRDFIATSIFPVMGTPVTETDVAFFQTACNMKTSALPHQPNTLASRLRSDVPADVLALLHRMLAYNPAQRPTLTELLQTPYVRDAKSPSHGLAMAPMLRLHPEPISVTAAHSTAPPPHYVYIHFPTDISSQWEVYEHCTHWNTRVFPTDLLLSAWEHFQSSGSLIECAYVWLTCMCMSTRFVDDGDISAAQALVGMMTLVAATTCLFHNRCNTLFVQNITPGLQQRDLFRAELHALAQCDGVIASVPLWFHDIKHDASAIADACTRVCRGVRSDIET